MIHHVGVLDDQSIYLELCIKTVLNLYKHLPNPPTSVSIVAHSMVRFNVQLFTIERKVKIKVNAMAAVLLWFVLLLMGILFFYLVFLVNLL